jgi:DNA-binding response OmpR family regulator
MSNQPKTNEVDQSWPKWELGGVVWILEDDARERAVLVHAVKQSCFDVREFDSLASFMSALESDDAPDAVVADINLEDGSFFDVFSDYAPLKIPTIILSGVVTATHVHLVEEKGGKSISLLEKPAKPSVLAARIVSMAKRAYIERGRSDILTLDTKNHTVYNKCGKTTITKLDMHMLAAIEATDDYKISIKDLIKTVWPDERTISKERVRVNMSRLNKKLADIGLRINYRRADESFRLELTDDNEAPADLDNADEGLNKVS